MHEVCSHLSEMRCWNYLLTVWVQQTSVFDSICIGQLKIFVNQVHLISRPNGQCVNWSKLTIESTKVDNFVIQGQFRSTRVNALFEQSRYMNRAKSKDQSRSRTGVPWIIIDYNGKMLSKILSL